MPHVYPFTKRSNSELLAQPDGMLYNLERQVKMFAKVGGEPRPCPNCGCLQTQHRAAGFDFDDFDFSGTTKYEYRCEQCRRALEYSMGGLVAEPGVWHWRLVQEPDVGAFNNALDKEVVALVAKLQKDEAGEGDLNEFSADVVAEALRRGLILVVPSDRPYRNIRLK